MEKTDLIVILGSTATGKTQLATNLAAKINGEIISADSRQVYKGMDVGTGKDLSDFTVNGKQIPHHLIDIIDAGEEYNVFEFQTNFLEAYTDIKNNGTQAILCGGTGMYIESAIKGYRLIQTPANNDLRKELEQKTDKELATVLSLLKRTHNTTDLIERDRIIRAIEIGEYEKKHQELIHDYPQINYQLFGIQFDRGIIKERITSRLKHRIKNEGMIDEVKKLIASGVSSDKLKFYGLEYKFITQYLLGEINRQELFELLNIAIHQFSKRQATWFRKMERNGFEINWIDGNLPLNEKVNYILNKLGE
jgi:tRNA dimethylallyltransferase